MKSRAKASSWCFNSQMLKNSSIGCVRQKLLELQGMLFLENTRQKGSSYYSAQVEGLLPKLLSRGEERSPLKYIMNVFLSNFEYFIEKMFGLLARVWISILGVPKLLSRGRTLGAKSAAI